MTSIEAQNTVNAGEDLNSFGAGMDFFGGFGDFFASAAPETPQVAPVAEQPAATVVSTPNITVETDVAVQPTTEAPVVTAEVKEEIPAENDNNTQPDTPIVETPEPPVEEKPKKRKITTRKTKKSKEAVTEEDTNENTISIENTRSQDAPDSTDMVYIPIDPTLDIRAIISSLNLIPDPKFMETQKDIEKKMNAIKIEKNIDKANITLMYDYIDELSDILRSNYAVVKTVYDNLVNKEVGMITNVKKLNMIGPGTVADKERNAIKCLMAYKTDMMPEPINLIQLSWAANYEFNFLESAIEQLETKRRILRGMEEAIF